MSVLFFNVILQVADENPNVRKNKSVEYSLTFPEQAIDMADWCLKYTYWNFSTSQVSKCNLLSAHFQTGWFHFIIERKEKLLSYLLAQAQTSSFSSDRSLTACGQRQFPPLLSFPGRLSTFPAQVCAVGRAAVIRTPCWRRAVRSPAGIGCTFPGQWRAVSHAAVPSYRII